MLPISDASLADPGSGRFRRPPSPSDLDAPPLWVGGRYRVHATLGEGAMAEVFHVEDRDDPERALALKLLQRGRPSGAAAATFWTEIERLRTLNHPGIQQLFEVGIDAVTERFFYTMPLISGGDLVQATRGLDGVRCVGLLLQTARALAYVHGHGVIHNDIKPANILVISGEAPQVVLIDFGLSSRPGTLEAHGAGGTPHYMAPEKLFGGSSDQRSDLFSLGLTFYEVLTGKPYYPTDCGLREVLHHWSGSATEPSLPDSIPLPLRPLLSTMLACRPDDRPDDVGEVVQALEAFLASGETGSRDPRPGDTDRGVEGRTRLDGLVGRSSAMQRVYDIIRKASASQAPVLIRGESGTGKELAARALHRLSDRAECPFVVENCGALPDTIFESEMFGHSKGAFSGAEEKHLGIVRYADGGTLFLDEIAELSMENQRKLLRVLDSGEVRPLGSVDVHRVDLRLITATHRCLPELVEQGLFRADLYYRINVVSLELPPLRHRREDIAELAAFLLQEICPWPRFHATELAPDALHRLQMHSWPGNVRELRNVLSRAVLFATSPTIQAEDLQLADPEEVMGPQAMMEAVFAMDFRGARERFARLYLERALGESEGNIAKAARAMGITRQALQEHLVRHKLDARVFRRRRPFGIDREVSALGLLSRPSFEGPPVGPATA